jgi:hypothetical protein
MYGWLVKEQKGWLLSTSINSVEPWLNVSSYIAKRIERGKWDVLSVALNCPIAVRKVINLGGALRAGRMEIREVTNKIDDEEADVEKEQIQKKRVLTLIDKIQRGEERIRILRGELKLRNKEVRNTLAV